MDINLVLAGVSGVILGAVIAGLWVHQKVSQMRTALVDQQAHQTQQAEEAKAKLDSQQQRLEQLHEVELNYQRTLGELQQKSQQITTLSEEKAHWQSRWQSEQQALSTLKGEQAAERAGFEKELAANQDKLVLLEKAEQRLTQQFENLANKIFEDKAKNFSESNKQGLDALLSPLKEQIEGFKKQVGDQYVREGQERASLKTEILSLKELNQKITEDAAALTRALKGDNKQQGNWGEVVLSKILSQSGLREGQEYQTQSHFVSEEGKAFKPDVIVNLPNEKQVIIDSKVSLSAYEKYFNAEMDDDNRERFLTEHVNSLKGHIKGLGKKDYQKLDGVKTLDYVLMFVPIEPAFLLAIDHSPELVSLALDNNIMLVSPTNLLVALRTINNIWQYEYQNQNAQLIAKKAADLYDKFVLFSDEMESFGTSLQTVNKKYEGAMKKLSTGKGNLVRRAEEFRSMGVQSSKKVNQKLLDRDGLESDD